ncbi:MAG: FKBP-type peptidyl-prolyl cis-trans isomerase, partial [Lachnospiraceae bacterium]|nr:FKBP-type peptidyl-prolyl cis-trans isomerase [Lachnospiraceae bacterium]
MVEKIKASSIVTLPSDYLSISVPKSEVEYTEDMFAEEMEKQLNNHKVLDTETDKAVESGDTINLDYVGSVDGVEFEGGSTDGAGTDLEIGSGTYIPGFEDQIIGHKVSENFDINVTFPDDYAKAELAGKDAVFNITVNGIYTLSQFTDSFVAENLKATGCKSVTEYRKYLEDSYYKSQLDQYITNYINENSSVSKYPSKYLKQLMALKMYSDQSSYEYMNQLYISYSGQGFSSFEEYTGMSQEDYQASVDEAAKNECTSILAH